MYIFNESACIIDYCTSWVVGEWFVCIAILQVSVDFSEVVPCVHYANVSTFITCFDGDGLIITSFIAKKVLCQHASLELIPGFVSGLKVLVGLGKKDKPLVNPNKKSAER